jgi:hypothetical protein
VADARAGKIFTQVPENVAFRKGLYEVPNPNPEHLGDHIDLWGYESGLTGAIDELIDRDTPMDAKPWLDYLVPFVAGLFARGPDANAGQNNAARIMAFQEMLAPVMVSKWTVLHYSSGEVVTSDRAIAAVQTPIGPGIAIPLDPSHALLLSHETERIVAQRENAAWHAPIDYIGMNAKDALELRAALSAFAFTSLFGPTRESVTIDLGALGTDNETWPDLIANPDNCDLNCHLYDYFRVLSAVSTRIGDGQAAADRIDLDAAVAWRAPIAVQLNFVERTCGGVTVEEGSAVHLSVKLGTELCQRRRAIGDFRRGNFSIFRLDELQPRGIKLGRMCRDEHGRVPMTEIRRRGAGKPRRLNLAKLAD